MILEDGVPAIKNSIHKFSLHPRSEKGRVCVCVYVWGGGGGGGENEADTSSVV